MSCPECPHCKDSYPESLRKAIVENVEGIGGSASFVSLYSDAMKDFVDEPWPAIQLTIALLMEKPIVLLVRPDQHPPAKLVAIADAVLKGSTLEDLSAQLLEWHQKHFPQ